MPFRVFAEVQSEMNFAAYDEAVKARVNAALIAGAEITLEQIRAHETRVGVPRRDGELPGVHVPHGVHLRDSFRAIVFKFGSFGFKHKSRPAGFSVFSDNPNAIWQELGTRGRRSTPTKSRRRKQSSHGGGVTPLRFMRRGMAAAYPEVVRLIQEAVAGAGVAGAPGQRFGTGSTSFRYPKEFAGVTTPGTSFK